jgi:hypothetical protein
LALNTNAPGYTPYEESFESDLALKDIPLGRARLPKDQASAALFLATEESSWIYPNNLKNWFLTRRPRIFALRNERPLCEHKARVPKQKFAAKPTLSKTNFSSCLGITGQILTVDGGHSIALSMNA